MRNRSKTGPCSLGVPCLVLALAALILGGIADSAKAQYYPFWGGWQRTPPWGPRHRQPHREARPPSEDETSDHSTAPPTPKGPPLLVVSINRQHITVYDGDQQIATAPISSGMPGRQTPTGIFSVIEKDLYHESNIYSGAPMPHMERITFSGVALHGGVLPGYPASHGCIRLPYGFARNLFGITQLGARVIVANDDLKPTSFSDPWLMAPLPPDDPAKGTSTVADATIAGERPRTRGMAAAARAAEREQLAAAVPSAETAKTAAIAAAKTATEAASAAKAEVAAAKSEAERLAYAVAKAKDAASAAEHRFVDLMGKSAKLDPAKLDADTFKKEADDEVAEEAKVMDLMDAVEAAKALAAKQVEAVKAAAARAGAAEAARRSATEEVKKAEKALASAQAALAAADRLEARKNLPVSVLISARTGRLSARLGFEPVIDVPVTISDPEKPLGSHLFTATEYGEGERSLHWTVVSLSSASITRAEPSRKPWGRYYDEEERYYENEDPAVVESGEIPNPAAALARIQMPKDTADKLAELVKPGSSFIITDLAPSRETGKGTDFIIGPR